MIITFDSLCLAQGTFELSADFSIQKGRRVAILGPSGGGKSTLLSAIAGFHRPKAGRIFCLGRDITALEPHERPVSLLFQDHNLFPHLSVEDNVALGLKPSLRLSGAERQIVRDALGRVGLSGMDAKRPAELSGGQQQRVAIARVLLRDKPVLMLDEPFAALGPALRYEMLDLVREITDQTGATLLMVTHQPDDAHALADQTIFVADGEAHPPEETKRLMANPPIALQRYLGQADTTRA